jgi:ATP-grasp domain
MVQIMLENTLCDFFAAEDRRDNTCSPRKVFVSYNPISDLDLATKLPRNIKYPIQQWRNSNSSDFSSITNLILMPQRMSWITGKMAVIFFKDEKQDEQEEAIYSNLEDDLAETIGVINPQCRFEPSICTSLEQIHLSVGDSFVIPYLPSDGLAHLPHHTDPDDHYELLTKRALALSGLPTPNAQLIDFGRPETGWDSETLNNEVARAISTIHHRVRPFVLKSNSSGGSRGTYLVRTLADQAAVEKDVRNLLRSELQNLSLGNAHLHPCSLILTGFLLGKAVAINFYARNDGQGQFTSCCEQDFSKTGHWLGGAITYSTQHQLAALYAGIMQKTATFLHSRGYHGPVGIDVMTDEVGRHNVIDLNPRPTGSFILGCLRPHFAGELAMDEARVLPFMEFFASRAIFKTVFDKELRTGEIIILAWSSDLKTSRSFTCLAVGARDKVSLKELCGRIEEWVREMQSC